MSSPGDGVCQLHARPAQSTCKRCGGFLCDWCEKLAPSWGPGFCNECLHYVTPDTAHLGKMSFGVMFVVAFLAVLSFFSFVGLRTQLARRPFDLGGAIWTGSIGVGLALVAVFVLAQYWRKR